MKIRLVSFSETEIQMLTDKIQKSAGYYPSDLQVLDVLKDTAKAGFPGFKVKQITKLDSPDGIKMVLTKGQ